MIPNKKSSPEIKFFSLTVYRFSLDFETANSCVLETICSVDMLISPVGGCVGKGIGAIFCALMYCFPFFTEIDNVRVIGAQTDVVL